jgi:hypothetical protein
MKLGAAAQLSLLWLPTLTLAFSSLSSCHRRAMSRLSMAGDGSDAEWAKALKESTGPIPGQFEKDMKMKGLLGPKQGQGDPKVTANSNLVKWLEEQGQVYLSEQSAWGEAPHPMAISTETRDEITNESSGRGLLARKDVNDGDELLRIPLKLCFTKASARKALGKDVLPEDINEYLAIACQLIHERFVLGDKSLWKAYISVLPEIEDVNPTFTWPDEDLSFLNGSPVVAATKSLQMKLQREYQALFEGEKGFFARFPDRFPKEVGREHVHVHVHVQVQPIFPGNRSLYSGLFFHAAFYIQELALGIHKSIFEGHSAPKSQTRRSSCDGTLC